jgi:hypothetical protein
MEQIPIAPVNNDRTTINTSYMDIRTKFDQIIDHIRNFDGSKEQLKYINNEIKNFSRYRDPDNNSIFDKTSNGNNILLECCIHNIKPLCLEIVKNYGNLFDLGHYNFEDETALIYSIKHNWFYYAAFLIAYCTDSPFKTINELYIEKIDNQGKNALDYLFEKEKPIQSNFTYFQLEPNGEMKEMILLVELFGYFIDRFPNDPVTHAYITKICQDLAFYKDLLGPYFIDNPYIKFTKKFCETPVDTNAALFQVATPATQGLRSNTNTRLRARPSSSNTVLTIPDAIDENDSDDERIHHYPKNMTLPPPLEEYDPSIQITRINYPPPPSTNTINSNDEENKSDSEEEDKMKEKKLKTNKDFDNDYDFKPEFGGNKRIKYKYNKKSHRRVKKKKNITRKKTKYNKSNKKSKVSKSKH